MLTRSLTTGFIVSALCGLAQAQTTVFSNDFETPLPAAIGAGTGAITGVQGFSAYGFNGAFLRSATGNVVTLTLDNLPAHTAINVDFLFAAIDSLDGTGSVFPEGDFFNVALDGTTMFRESFANALASQTQSYMPSSPDLELVRMTQVGFASGFYYSDSAYNLGADSRFGDWAHTASSAVITFQIEGAGIQELNDETWAMDQLVVSITPVPEPSSVAMLLAGLALMAGFARRRLFQV